MCKRFGSVKVVPLWFTLFKSLMYVVTIHLGSLIINPCSVLNLSAMKPKVSGCFDCLWCVCMFRDHVC